MKQKLNKNETITLIKKATNIECHVEHKNNSFTINLKGDIVPKQDQEITLKSIYELMNKKFELIENEILLIKKEINSFKDLPTISKEIKENELYKDYSSEFKK